MTQKSESAQTPRSVRARPIALILVVVALLVLAVPVLIKFYLVSPLAPRHLSRILTSYLHAPVSVSGLEIRSGTVIVRGLSIANQSGFSSIPLAAVDALAVTPRWLELLRGVRSFRRIELQGARITLEKNSAGAWNVAELRRRFAKKGAPAPQTIIGELAISRGMVTVDGRRISGIELRLEDLSTGGASDAPLALTFADGAGNRYRVEGKVRPGSKASFDLVLTAPSLTLAPMDTMFRHRGISLGKGSAGVRIEAAFAGERLQTGGSVVFRNVEVKRGKATIPLAGRVTFGGWYDLQRDEAQVQNLTVSLADIATGRCAATVGRVRTERAFVADVSVDDVDLRRLSSIVSSVTARPVVLAGSVGSRGVRITGDGIRGVTGIEGDISALGVSVAYGGREIIKGVDGTVAVASDSDGFHAGGKLVSTGNSDATLIEGLDLPFSIYLSSRFLPRQVEVPALTARVMGMPVTGRISFRPDAARPLVASLRVPTVPFVMLAPYLDRYRVRPAGGTVSLLLNLQGKGPQSFDGEAVLRGNSLAADAKGRSATLGEGVVRSRFAREGGGLTAAGSFRFDNAEFDGKKGALRTSFGFSGRAVTLDGLRGSLAATAASADHVILRFPGGLPTASKGSVPLSLEVSGGAAHHGKTVASGLSASIRGDFSSDAGGRWFEGGGTVSAAGLSIGGISAAGPSIGLSLSRFEGKANVDAKLFDGSLMGGITFNPAAPAAGAAFSLKLSEGKLAAVSGLFSGKLPVTPAEGVFAGTATGSFSRKDGILADVGLRADGVALAGQGGKRLLNGGGARIAGRVAGDRIVLHEGVATLGEAAALRFKGELERAYSPQRTGEFTFSLPTTPLDRLIDPVANALPRFIQEAVVAGNVAVEGTAVLQGKDGGVDGTLTLDGVSLDVPSQKFLVAAMSGNVPISFNTLAGAIPRPREERRFTRENFHRLLERLRQSPAGDRILTIGKVRFGPLELGETTAFLRGGNGIMQLTALRSGLSGGEVLGRGFLAVNGGLSYGGDILVYDLSLRRFCDTIPQIKGYVSGRLDGIASLYGSGKGLAGLDGLTEFWVRDTKGEKMLLSKEFLQRIAGKKLRGFFFRDDRPFDRGEVSAYLENGYLTFTTLDISHTNMLGIRDLSVSVAPIQNRIALDHLFSALKEAATRGKAVSRGEETPAEETPVQTDFQWRD